jgi:RHS repeat-associated protein
MARCRFIVSLMLLLVSVASAQTTNNAALWSDTAGASLPIPYDGVTDKVNLANGNLNVTIPLVSLPGRAGQNLDFSYQSDSQTYHLYTFTNEYTTTYSWLNNPWQKWGIFYLVDTADLAGFFLQNGGGPFPVYCDHFGVVTPDGSWLTFDNIENCMYQGGYTPYPLTLSHVNGVTKNAMEFAKLDTTNPSDIVFTDRQGNQAHFSFGTSYFSGGYCVDNCIVQSNKLLDPNGNTITLTSGGSSTYTLTDNMGRVVTASPSAITYPDSNSPGGTAQITISNSSISGPTVSLHATNCGQAPFQSPSISGSGLNAQIYAFPNGSTLTVTTDALGFVNSIVYPTGGYKRFWYDTFTTSSTSPPCQSMDIREVTHKFECSSGTCGCSMTASNQACTGETETTYTPTLFAGIPYNSQNILQAYDGAATSGSLLRKDSHSFTNLQTLNGAPDVRETSVQTLDSSGNMVRTIATSYMSCDQQHFGNVLLSSTTTYPVLPSGAVSTSITYGYPSITVSDPYYHSPSPICFDKPSSESVTDFTGSVLRKTYTAYAWQGTSSYQNNEMLDLISSVEVDDGGGTKRGYTSYGYDEYALQPSGVTVQHTTGASPPGNQTSAHRWLNGSATATTKCPITINNGYAVSYKKYFDTATLYQATDECGASAGDASHTTTYSYSSAYVGAYPTTITNPAGQPFNYAFDFNSGAVTSATDPNSQPITKTYDVMTRLTQVSYPDGGTTSFCYTDLGGSMCTAAPPPLHVVTKKAITTSLNKTSTVILDGFGRVSQTQLNSDTPSTTYTLTQYDALGRKSQVYNPTRCAAITQNCGESTWGYTAYHYDPLDRTTSAVEQDGSTVGTTYSGNCTTVTDEAQKSRKSCSDALGRLTGVWEDPSALNYETDYQYSALGDLLSVTQKGGTTDTTKWRSRTFQYDSLSRLTSASNPESGAVTYGYDADGNLITKTAPKPNQTGTATVQTTYTYDVLNRTTKKSYNDGTTATVQFGYDAVALSGCTTGPPGLTDSYPVGRRTSMCDGSGGTSWAHDKMGRVLKERRTIGSVIGDYENDTFNLDGSVATVTSLGYGVTYTYAGAGRPLTASHSTTKFVSGATYAPPGELRGMTMGSATGFAGITVANAYNNRLQPILLSAASPSGTVFSECFDLHLGVAVNSAPCSFSASTAGDNGNVYQIVNNRDNTRNQNFIYDSLNRIQQAYSSGTQWGETFGPTATSPGVPPTTPGIDAWGNLTNRSGVTGKTNFESLNAPAGTNNQLPGFGYDAAGNMTSNGSTSYVYDAENRLIWTSGYRYLYDANGERVEKCVAATSTTACPTSGTNGTLYWKGAGSDPLSETELSGNVQNTYVFFNGQRVARSDSAGAIHYYFSDHLGSHGVVENSTGSTCEQDIDYYPYGGQERDYCPNAAQNYKFTSKERDSESNLDMFGARYYGSSMGRFMTPDWNESPDTIPHGSLKRPQSLNLYAYVENTPISVADPDGHETCKDGSEASACVYATPPDIPLNRRAQAVFGNPIFKQASKTVNVFGGILVVGGGVVTGGIAFGALAGSGGLTTLGIAALPALPTLYAAGQQIDEVIETPQGPVRIVAEVVDVVGSKLTVKDVAVYATETGERVKVGTGSMVRALQPLFEQLKQGGYTSVRILGDRSIAPGSANPGRAVDVTKVLR